MIPRIELVHADNRGEIYSIALPDGQELMLLHSVAGSLRGGHSHSCDEVVLLLSGKMRYLKHIDSFPNDTVSEEMAGGDLSYNPAGQNHMGEALTDLWLIEYKFAKKGEWTQANYPPYREQVEESARASNQG